MFVIENWLAGQQTLFFVKAQNVTNMYLSSRVDIHLEKNAINSYSANIHQSIS